MNEQRLGETLIKLGAINALDLAKAAQHQKKEGGTLANALIAIKAVTAQEMARVAATLLKMPYVSLREVSVPQDMVKLMTADVAAKCQAVPLKKDGRKYYVAMAQPTNIDHIDMLRFRLNGDVIPVVVPDQELERAIDFYYGKLKNTPLSLPSSADRDYQPEQFDIRKARAAQQAQAAPAPKPKPAPKPAAAPEAQAAKPAEPKAPPAPAAPVAPVAAKAPEQPVEAEEEVLDLAPEAEATPEGEKSEQPSDDELIKELANFLLNN